jgi:hypothetical protein
MSSVYEINKGIGKPIVFRGLKAQWIWWLGGGLAVLLLVFAVMYIVGVNLLVCVVFIVGSGVLLFMNVYRLSRKYGEHGLMKEVARKSVPKGLKGSIKKSVVKELK